MKTFEVVYYQHPRWQGFSESHRYTESWEITDWHCPKCGVQDVWQDQGGGDYYVGAALICVACAFAFDMPNVDEIVDRGLLDSQDSQRLAALRDNTAVLANESPES